MSASVEKIVEMIDVVNESTGERIETLTRAEVHHGAHWHQVFHCLVVRPSAGSIVLQQRSLSKAAFPGMLDLSVTGHLSAGETPLDGIREAEEELGVTLDPDDLVFVGIRLLADDNGEGRNRERVNLFFLADDRPIDAYAPPADEVAALIEVTVDDFLLALTDPDIEVPCQRAEVDGAQPHSGSARVGHMRQDDLVEGSSGYWITLGVMAQRFIRGQKPIAI